MIMNILIDNLEVNKMTNLNYNQAITKFNTRVKSQIPHYDKVASEENSSERMGGWLIRDINNMIIGFVDNRGGVQVHDYIDASKAS